MIFFPMPWVYNFLITVQHTRMSQVSLLYLLNQLNIQLVESIIHKKYRFNHKYINNIYIYMILEFKIIYEININL